MNTNTQTQLVADKRGEIIHPSLIVACAFRKALIAFEWKCDRGENHIRQFFIGKFYGLVSSTMMTKHKTSLCLSSGIVATTNQSSFRMHRIFCPRHGNLIRNIYENRLPKQTRTPMGTLAGRLRWHRCCGRCAQADFVTLLYYFEIRGCPYLI